MNRTAKTCKSIKILPYGVICDIIYKISRTAKTLI